MPATRHFLYVGIDQVDYHVPILIINESLDNLGDVSTTFEALTHFQLILQRFNGCRVASLNTFQDSAHPGSVVHGKKHLPVAIVTEFFV